MKLVLPEGVPTWLWISGAVLLLVVVAIAFRLLRVAARNRKELRNMPVVPASGTAEEQAEAEERRAKARRATRLVNIAAVVCLLLYLGLFASSFQAIAGFAKDFLKREGIYIPATPLTLDGVVVGALLLSLAFVAKRKSPTKAHILIWGMTLFAAYCGFSYGEHGADGSEGSLAAGLYYAVMSVVGMFMFHMVLELFQDDGDYVRSKYPAMGLRWFTHWSTLPVMLNWINHPPCERDDEQRPTVREAIDHWQHISTVRARARTVAAAAAHTRKLDEARRQGELAAIRREAEAAAAQPAVAPAPQPATVLTAVAQPIHPAPRPTVVAFDGASRPTTVTAAVPAPMAESEPTTQVKVPATSEACATWMDQWVKLAAAYPQFAAVDSGSGIKNEEAQATAGCSDRQARHVRFAARSGQLRAKAAELGVKVPTGYQDRPENDRRLTAVS